MGYFLTSLALCATFLCGTNAYIGSFVGCSTSQTAALNSALAEAYTVASSVSATLKGDSGLTKDYLRAAILPLFFESDISTITNHLDAMARQTTSGSTGPKITFICDDSFLVWSTKYNIWRDKLFTWVPAGKSSPQPMQLSLGGWTDPNTSPTTKGSFTTVGWKNSAADISDQIHIYIATARFGSNPNADTRAMSTIISDGLKPNFNTVTSIKPLSNTVIHELLHAVGGTNSGKILINDGPNKDTYGWAACSQMHIAFQNKNSGSQDPLTIADCLTQATKAVYLQIKNTNNNPTFWSTGVVDPTTLNSILTQSTTSQTKREISWVA